ncbi:MAG: hypothetical protein KDA74_20905, partial [Planctomycetaceae bacterium]|nr:hypothetical protein [Planctomycetaceae bacterium]
DLRKPPRHPQRSPRTGGSEAVRWGPAAIRERCKRKKDCSWQILIGSIYRAGSGQESTWSLSL